MKTVPPAFTKLQKIEYRWYVMTKGDHKYMMNHCITHLSVHLGIFTLDDYLKEIINGNVRNTTFCHNIPSVFNFLQ